MIKTYFIWASDAEKALEKLCFCEEYPTKAEALRKAPVSTTLLPNDQWKLWRVDVQEASL